MSTLTGSKQTKAVSEFVLSEGELHKGQNWKPETFETLVQGGQKPFVHFVFTCKVFLRTETVFEKARGQPQLIQHLKADSFNLSSVFPWGIKTRPLGRIMSRKGDECVNHKLEDLASRSV